MKKAIMQVSIASPHWSYYPGEEVTLTDELAAAWEECGHAKIIGNAPNEAAQTHKDESDKFDNTDAGVKPEANPVEGGENNELKSDNAADGGTDKPGRGKKNPKN